MVAAGDFRPAQSKQPARNALEAVDQFRERDLGRILDEEMDVVVLAVAFYQADFEVPTNFGEDVSEIADGRAGEDITAAFGDKDQMSMEREYTMSASAIGVVSGHRPSYSADMPKAQHPDMAPTQTLTIKLRLYDRHAPELDRQAHAVNVVWNYCNEVSRRAWERDRRILSYPDLAALTAGSGAELDIHSHTVQRVCRQFVDSRTRARRAGLRWRGRKSLGWVPFNTGHVAFNGEVFRFRGRIYRTMHMNPRLEAGMPIGAGSFNRDSRGRWYINVPVEIACTAVAPVSRVGIDLGLKDLATLSIGGRIETPKFYRSSEERLANVQRARKTKRVRSIHRKVANRRKDFLHKASSALAKEYGLIVVGDASPSKLARTRMAKSVLDASWADLKRMLSYKALMHGGRMVEVSEHLTTQTCSECGALPASRPKGIAGLRIREWRCDDCGAVNDRDVNAARNILRLGLETLAEGAPA